MGTLQRAGTRRPGALGVAAVHHGRPQEPQAGVPVRLVVPGKEDLAGGAGVWQRAQWPGKAARCFRISKYASENGLSVAVHGVDLGHAQVGQQHGHQRGWQGRRGRFVAWPRRRFPASHPHRQVRRAVIGPNRAGYGFHAMTRS